MDSSFLWYIEITHSILYQKSNEDFWYVHNSCVNTVRRTFHKYSLFMQLKTLIFSYGTLSTLLILAVRSSSSTQVDNREILIINLRES